MLIGVVGKANVGKSTFFKASTLAEVEIANYPFATIKPNQGVGYVKVEDPAIPFGKVSNPRDGFVKGKWRFVPIQLLDVAGLVPGAHKGEGLGLQFLNDLNMADALIHVIDCSGGTNEKGNPVAVGSYDPAQDVKMLEEELDYWYLDILKRGWDKLARQMQAEKNVALVLGKQLSGVGSDEELMKRVLLKLGLFDKPPQSWTDAELFQLAHNLRKETKPMLIACNKVDVPGARENAERLRKEFPDYAFIACSAESELALKEASKNELIDYTSGEHSFEVTHEEKLTDAQKKGIEFLKGVVAKGTGVQEVLNTAVFDLLERIAIFPGGAAKLEDKDGNTLPDCFLMKPKSTALDFAFALHTDFGKHFIRAIDVKTKRTVGKEHPLQDGDIVEIVADK